MEHAMPTVHYSPGQPPGYFDGFGQGTHMYNPNAGVPMLHSLLTQRNYLDHLLAKNAITLNALRERQTRNGRALSLNPTPRSRRKKIEQNRWRTGKTITNCENEERIILDCLQVCNNNIRTLETLLSPSNLYSTAVECTPNHSEAISSDTASLEWDGWTDEAPISPFVRERVGSTPLDEVPPETLPEEAEFDRTCGLRLPPLPPRARPIGEADVSLAPLNTASTEFAGASLSADTTAFEPAVSHVPQGEDEMAAGLDKLSISGLLTSKRMKVMQRKRFSGMAIGHMFRRPVSDERPVPPRSHRSWASSPQRQALAEQLGREWASSTTSV